MALFLERSCLFVCSISDRDRNQYCHRRNKKEVQKINFLVGFVRACLESDWFDRKLKYFFVSA